ncbi:MAG: hypothetical protein V1779_10895 [bacterium]
MGRIEFGKMERGSQRDLQVLINKHPDLLNNEIIKTLSLTPDTVIKWVSPIECDDFAEYRDDDFLKVLGIKKRITKPLKEFWPKKGPQWDALGIANDAVIIVEAKANIPEFVTPACSAESQKSIKLINKSIDKVKNYLNVRKEVNWTGKFYQYANRIAHLYYLQVLNDIPTYLVNIYFYNDDTIEYSPKSKEEWETAILIVKSFLEIRNHKLSEFMVDVFVDVKNIIMLTNKK